MGYRSDVVLAAEFETKDLRDAAWTAAKLRYQLQDYMWEKFEHFHECAIVFDAENIKWYLGSYPEVDAVNEMFLEFWRTDFDANVKVVIVGEEADDVTDDTFECESGRDYPDWFWDLYISRSIQTPW